MNIWNKNTVMAVVAVTLLLASTLFSVFNHGDCSLFVAGMVLGTIIYKMADEFFIKKENKNIDEADYALHRAIRDFLRETAKNAGISENEINIYGLSHKVFLETKNDVENAIFCSK